MTGKDWEGGNCEVGSGMREEKQCRDESTGEDGVWRWDRVFHIYKVNSHEGKAERLGVVWLHGSNGSQVPVPEWHPKGNDICKTEFGLGLIPWKLWMHMIC